jgi:CheY-like chemotaxis protein
MQLLLRHLTAGVLAPPELLLLQNIFDEICAEAWFPRDVEARRDFAAYILTQYRRGLVAPDRLAAFAIIAARQKFANALPLSGALILLVEDDYYVAAEAAAQLREGGAEVLGPSGSVAFAMALLEHRPAPSAALLDVKLEAETVFPLAAALADRGIPYVFMTGHGLADIPPPERTRPVFHKPACWSAVISALSAFTP